MTCDIWDTDYNTDNWEPGIMTIFVPWQLIVTLDSIHNSCDVCSWRVISIRYTKHTEICWSQPAACVTGWSSPQGWQPWRQAPHPRTAVPAALPACPGRRPHYCFRPGFDLHWCTFFSRLPDIIMEQGIVEERFFFSLNILFDVDEVQEISVKGFDNNPKIFWYW